MANMTRVRNRQDMAGYDMTYYDKDESKNEDGRGEK